MHLSHSSQSGYTALHLLINRYHSHPEQSAQILNTVKKLLEFYPNEQLSTVMQGLTPLLRATVLGFLEMVTLIMQFDCRTQLTQQNETKILPIHCACDKQNMPIIKALLQQDAVTQLNIPYNNFTPIYQATLSQNSELIELIVATDATTLLALLPDGMNLLHIAAFIGNAAIAEYLIKRVPNSLCKSRRIISYRSPSR